MNLPIISDIFGKKEPPEVSKPSSPKPSANGQALDTMKQSFVSIAAHELRTPLTSIKSYLSVFMKDYGQSLNQDQKELLGHISSATEQLMGLVENLLNVTRVERGSLSLNTALLDLSSLAKETVEDFKETAIEKNIKLEYTPTSSQSPQALADKVRIKEVLSNLINNALCYTPTGGAVKVSVEQAQGEVIVHVADNGSGISKEALPNLFTKFYRADNNPLTVNHEGTGLGLYISKAIIDMHKGKIWVQSQPGKGSTFSFSLPAE